MTKAKARAKTKAIRMPGKERPAASRLVIQKPPTTEPHQKNLARITKPLCKPVYQARCRGSRVPIPSEPARVIGPGSLRKARPRRSDSHNNMRSEPQRTRHQCSFGMRSLQMHPAER